MAFAGTRTAGPNCPNCCVECIIGTDLFDGSRDLWTDTGSVVNTAGSMVVTGAGLFVFDTAVPSVDDWVRVYTDALNTSTDGTVRLMVAKSDDDNYLFGQFAISGSGATIRAGQRVAGVETWLTDAKTVDDTAAELNERSQLCLSWQPGEVEEPISSSTGPLEPTNYDEVGDVWTAPEEVLVLDDVPATIDCVTLGDPKSMNTGGFPVAIPPGSTIDGIRCTVRALGTQNSGMVFPVIDSISLLNGDGGIGDPKFPGTSLTASYDNYVFGGPTDNWGGVTWDELLDALSITVAFDGESNSVSLDYVGSLEIWFTTPERRPGRLRFSRTNTGDPQNTQCVTVYEAYSPDDGLKSGIKVDSGNWDFSSYHLEHRQGDGHPTCDVCNCDEGDEDDGGPDFDGGGQESCSVCCAPNFPPATQYSVNLGAGGWTANVENPCDDPLPTTCAAIVGILILDLQPPVLGPCIWFIQGPFTSCRHILTLEFVSDGLGGCKWELVVIAFTDANTIPNAQPVALAVYQSASLASDEDCQTMPVTLNKVFERANSNTCDGNLPATVELDLA